MTGGACTQPRGLSIARGVGARHVQRAARECEKGEGSPRPCARRGLSMCVSRCSRRGISGLFCPRAHKHSRPPTPRALRVRLVLPARRLHMRRLHTVDLLCRGASARLRHEISAGFREVKVALRLVAGRQRARCKIDGGQLAAPERGTQRGRAGRARAGQERLAGAALMHQSSGCGAQSRRRAIGRGSCARSTENRASGQPFEQGTRILNRNFGPYLWFRTR